MLSVVLSAEQLEVDLAAGQLACSDCGSPLARWGFARPRVVRLRGEVRSLTSRRACCRGCAHTHVLCPSWSVPGRLDGAQVIGEALGLAVAGLGHRPIEALMLAVRAWVLRFGGEMIGPWERVVWLTGGLLAACRTPP